MPTTSSPEPSEADQKRRDRSDKLREVSALHLGRLSLQEASTIVCVTLRAGEALPVDRSYVPTPADIAAACKVIQDGWDDVERERRTVTKTVEWRLQRCDDRALVA